MNFEDAYFSIKFFYRHDFKERKLNYKTQYAI